MSLLVFLLVLLSLVGAPLGAFAATVTISPGSSIQSALNSAGGGGTVILHGGTYSNQSFQMPSGSSGSPTTLRAFGDGAPIITFSGGCGWCLPNGNHDLLVDGVTIDGQSSGTFGVEDTGVSVDNSLRITIQNSEVRNTHHSCFLINGNSWRILNNHIHNCGTDTALDHGIYAGVSDSLIQGNFIHDCACHNIQNYNTSTGAHTDNNVYDSNTFTATNCGWVASTGNNVTFTNNLIYDDGLECNGCAMIQAWISNLFIWNNTIINGNITSRSLSNVQVRSNIFCNGSVVDGSVSLSSSQPNITTCSGFVNAGANNYHLTASSPAINVTPCLVSRDLDGNPRPSGSACDAGAYEFQTGGPTPPTVNLTATPSSLVAGQSATLTWSSSGAVTCSGTNFSTGTSTSGTVTVSPLSTTTYTLACTNSGGTSTISRVVTVTAAPRPTVSLTATPTTIAVGLSSTLTWASSDATSCTGTNFNASSLTAGSVSVSPTVTVTYSITCSGAGGTSLPAAATVTVTSATLPTASLTANPTTITSGQSSTLTWSSANATSCTGTGFSTGTAISGTATVSPTVTTTYSMTCTGGNGTSSPASATVTVTTIPQGPVHRVTPSGTDTGTCPVSAPCASLTYAITQMASGDTLQIGNGTYAEGNLNPPGGTSALHTTIIGDSQISVVIIGVPGAPLPGFRITGGHDWIDIRNLTLNGTQEGVTNGIQTLGNNCLIQDVTILRTRDQGIRLDNVFATQGCTVRNVTIHDGGRGADGCSAAAPEPGSCHGIYMQSNGNILDNVEAYHQNGYGIQNYPEGTNNTIKNSYLHDNANAGLLLGGAASGAIVYNTVITGNGLGIDMQANGQIYNNTIANNNGCEVYCDQAAILCNQNNCPGAILRNNIFFGHTLNTVINAATGGFAANDHNLTADPLFVNASTGDYRLMSGSPAIDQAIPVSFITTDRAGTLRPQGPAPDIGAYEFGASAPANFLPAPVNLRVTNNPNGP